MSSYGSGLLLSIWPWPIVFYFYGFVAVIWLILFVSCYRYRKKSWKLKENFYLELFQIFTCYDDPASHPFISEEEREYLQHEIGQLKRSEKLPTPPYKQILTSSPILAFICAQVNRYD